jgi:hypothetical protein
MFTRNPITNNTIIEHVTFPPNIPLKFHGKIDEFHQSRMHAIFSGNVNELECLRKTPLAFHHAPPHVN